MMHVRGTSLLSLALLCLSVTACGQEDEDDCELPEAEVVDSSGNQYRYLVESYELPQTRAESEALAFDLDGDSRGENLVGSSLHGYLFGEIMGYNLNLETNALVASGELLQLIDLQTTSLLDARGVGVSLALGNDLDSDPSNNHSGSEPLSVDSNVGVGLMSGGLANSRLLVELGTAPLAMTLPGLGEPIVFALTGARMDAVVSEDRIEGRIGGVISRAEIESLMMPGLLLGFERNIARDCSEGVCIVDSFGEVLLGFFDSNADGAISMEELGANSYLDAILRSPDLDLYDGNGAFAPNCEGNDESISVSIGFSAVRAAITP